MKNFLLATLAGGVVLFVLGGLIYELILGGFYDANTGSATNVNRETPIYWALIISELAMAATLVYVFQFAGVTTLADGLKVGAIFGLIFGIAIAFSLYGVTNWSNLTVAFVEPIVNAVRMALGGSVIGWVLGKVGSTAATAE